MLSGTPHGGRRYSASSERVADTAKGSESAETQIPPDQASSSGPDIQSVMQHGPPRPTGLQVSFLAAINRVEALASTAGAARLDMAATLLQRVAAELRETVLPEAAEPAQPLHVSGDRNWSAS